MGGDKLHTVAMCPQHARALDEKKLSGAGLSTHASEASLGGLGTAQTSVLARGRHRHFKFEEDRMGKGKRKVLVLRGNLPGWLTKGL